MADQIVVQIVVASGLIIVAVVTGLLSANWLNRKNMSRLTAAQATLTTVQAASQTTQTTLSTTEITDRIARDWLGRLDERVTAAERELQHERRIRRGAVAYIERLLNWISDRHPEGAPDLPQPPQDLVDYLLDVEHARDLPRSGSLNPN